VFQIKTNARIICRMTAILTLVVKTMSVRIPASVIKVSRETASTVMVRSSASPPVHKISGALCHGLCVCGVGVRKHLVSVNYRTDAYVDWSNFSVAYWGWLEEGSFRWSAPLLIQDGRRLGFRISQLEDKRLGGLIPFFCGSVIGGD
jgi:hypothetical protein